MHLDEVEPPIELRQVFKNFWHFCLDLGPGPASFEVLPDGYAEIIFYFGNAGGLTVQQGGPRLPSPFLLGLLDQPVRFTGSGWLDVVGIKCFPWTVFDLLELTVGRGSVFNNDLRPLRQPKHLFAAAASLAWRNFLPRSNASPAQGRRMRLPVVLRASRSAWAVAASARA